LQLQTIRLRRDFLAVRGGAKSSTPAFLLEAKFRSSERDGKEGRADEKPARFGFTVTKKLGNAVCRNRIRRRLKAAICQKGLQVALQGADYVVVARRAAHDMPYADLLSCVERGMSRVNAGLSASESGKARRRKARTGPDAS
jgi:ribonuclease P protein component